jgi:hypothetical protein
MTVATIISIKVKPRLGAFDFPIRIILILTQRTMAPLYSKMGSSFAKDSKFAGIPCS